MVASAPNAGARFLTGSTMGHVLRMTLTGMTGITFVFLVDLANLFWISQLGDQQLVAAIGFAFAIQFFSVSSGVGLMVAATAVVSRRIGEGRRDAARNEATSAMIITVAMQIIVALTVVMFRHELLDMAGATGETKVLAARYLLFTVPSLPIMALGLIGSAALRAEGDGKRAMYVTLGSGSVSMIVDPFLIIFLGLGLDGAAIAVIVSRLILGSLALRFAIGTHDLLARPNLKSIRACFWPFWLVAFPAILTQMATPFGNYITTSVIADFGDDAVAGWAVANRLTVVVFGGIFSLSGAIGGIFGQNYGAGLIDRIQSTFTDALKFCAVYAVVAWVVLALTAPWVIDLFGVVGGGIEVYNAFAYFGSASYFLAGALFVSNAAFNNLGKPGRSTLTNWVRDGLLTLPAALILAGVFGAAGVVYGQALAGALAGLVSALWARRFVQRLGAEPASLDLNTRRGYRDVNRYRRR